METNRPVHCQSYRPVILWSFRAISLCGSCTIVGYLVCLLQKLNFDKNVHHKPTFDYACFEYLLQCKMLFVCLWHNVYRVEKVLLGVHSIKEKDSRQTRRVKLHVPHPGFDIATKKNDLMLLKVK